jgi:hypothetical protein
MSGYECRPTHALSAVMPRLRPPARALQCDPADSNANLFISILPIAQEATARMTKVAVMIGGYRAESAKTSGSAERPKSLAPAIDAKAATELMEEAAEWIKTIDASVHSTWEAISKVVLEHAVDADAKLAQKDAGYEEDLKWFDDLSSCVSKG